jgi:hypothetical protein
MSTSLPKLVSFMSIRGYPEKVTKVYFIFGITCQITQPKPNRALEVLFWSFEMLLLASFRGSRASNQWCVAVEDS